ncbi:MAG: hypothetical protein R3F29_09350 [Planctomycetota bacterium]
MSIRPHARLGLFALVVALAPMPACRAPQAQQVQTAGMRIDVLKARQKRGTVDVAVRIWNDHDVPLSFDNGNVRLMFGDREASAQRARRPPLVQGRGNEEFRFIFECGSELAGKQDYDIEIRDIQLDGVPAGDTAVFKVRL